MTDRELLELAAKAAGIPIHVWGAKGKESVADMTDPSNHKLWNPLTDDGDALRLAVRLNMEVCSHANADIGGISWADASGHASAYIELPHDSDPMAATRRAIVRAAAEIGRSA
jgi:hypothetical protein